MDDLKEVKVLGYLKKRGWYKSLGRWNNKYLNENANGLSLNEVLILEGIK